MILKLVERERKRKNKILLFKLYIMTIFIKIENNIGIYHNSTKHSRKGMCAQYDIL